MKEKLSLEKILKAVIIIIAIIVLSFIVILNLRYEVTISLIEEHTNVQNMNILKLLIYLIISIGITIITYFINHLDMNKNLKKVVTIVSIVFYAIFQIMWIKASLVKTDADSGMIYGTAKLFFNNENIMKEHILEYFAYYKQNIGLVVLYEIMMKIFRTDNVILIRYSNVVFNVLMVIGLYYIYRMINENKGKLNTLLFYVLILGFVPISLLSIWVYGDFIGLSLGIWSIAFMIKYIKNKDIKFFIFSAISMATSIIARGNSLIFIIAMVIYLLFTLREDKIPKEKMSKALIIILFIIISIFPNKILTDFISNKYQLNDRKEKSVITYLYMGVSEGKMANGWYNDEIDDINNKMKKESKNDKTIENETKVKLKERIKFLLKNPKYAFWFYKYKILSMWAEPTMASQVYNTQRDIDMYENKMSMILFNEQNFEIIKASQKIINYIIFAGSLICVIIKRRDMNNEMILLILVFLGGFSFHILWEAKSRYIIPYVVILIPVAVEGISEISIILKNKICHRKLLKKGEKGEKEDEKNINSNTNVLRRRSS